MLSILLIIKFISTILVVQTLVTSSPDAIIDFKVEAFTIVYLIPLIISESPTPAQSFALIVIPFTSK